MKTLICCLVALVVLGGCATTPPMKYEKTPFIPPPKSEAYKLPDDPTSGIPAPTFIYLKKDATGKYVVCPKAEAEIYALTSQELNKITIKLQYVKDVLPQLEKLINIHIQREGVLIDLLVDQNTAKELFKEMFVEMYNKNATDKKLFNMEKGGYIAVILGILIEMGILIAK